MRHPADVLSLAWSPDGKRLACGIASLHGPSVWVWDARTGEPDFPLLQATTGAWATAVAWNPSGDTLVAGFGSRTSARRSGSPLVAIDMSSPVRSEWRWGTLPFRMLVVGGFRWKETTDPYAPELVIDGHAVQKDLDGKLLTQEEIPQNPPPFGRHQGGVASLSWTRKAAGPATGGTDGRARVWDFRSNDPTPLTRHAQGTVLSVAWSPDGKRLASGGADDTARISGPGDLVLKHPNDVTSVAWSPDGSRLLSGCFDHVLRIWDARSGELLKALEGHPGPILSVGWSPDGKTLLSAGEDAAARSLKKDSALLLWNAETGALLRRLEGHTAGVTCVAWSPDGSRIASGSRDQTARIWDPETGREALVFEAHQDQMTSVDWHPPSGRIATGSRDRTVRIWEAGTGRHLRALRGHAGAVLGVAWSPDAKRLTSVGEDNTLRVWDGEYGGELGQAALAHCVISVVAWSPRGDLLLTGGEDKLLRLWSPDPLKEVRRLEGHTGWIVAAAFSPDGSLCATSARDQTARLWDPATGAERARLVGHTGVVTGFAFHPDGESLLTSGWDGTVRLWSLPDGKLVRTFGQSRRIAEVDVLDEQGKPVRKTRKLVERLPYLGVCWDEKGSEFYAGDSEGSVFHYDPSRPPGTEVADILVGTPLTALDGGPGHRFVRAGTDSSGLVWHRP